MKLPNAHHHVGWLPLAYEKVHQAGSWVWKQITRRHYT